MIAGGLFSLSAIFASDKIISALSPISHAYSTARFAREVKIFTSFLGYIAASNLRYIFSLILIGIVLFCASDILIFGRAQVFLENRLSVDLYFDTIFTLRAYASLLLSSMVLSALLFARSFLQNDTEKSLLLAIKSRGRMIVRTSLQGIIALSALFTIFFGYQIAFDHELIFGLLSDNLKANAGLGWKDFLTLFVVVNCWISAFFFSLTCLLISAIAMFPPLSVFLRTMFSDVNEFFSDFRSLFSFFGGAGALALSSFVASFSVTLISIYLGRLISSVANEIPTQLFFVNAMFDFFTLAITVFLFGQIAQDFIYHRGRDAKLRSLLFRQDREALTWFASVIPERDLIRFFGTKDLSEDFIVASKGIDVLPSRSDYLSQFDLSKKNETEQGAKLRVRKFALSRIIEALSSDDAKREFLDLYKNNSTTKILTIFLIDLFAASIFAILSVILSYIGTDFEKGVSESIDIFFGGILFGESFILNDVFWISHSTFIPTIIAWSIFIFLFGASKIIDPVIALVRHYFVVIFHKNDGRDDMPDEAVLISLKREDLGKFGVTIFAAVAILQSIIALSITE
ncbi:hypothetical protein QWY75_07825 [Pontixanthobacter aestiaquae]|uniref:Uncharacterized protein n=1 Tax=Pontixanthobacter aestiaquae TaxID=1509367 RepID=A0A844Z4P6_9SPHN|nr:hypothetical protein [Pontixanthobacter aestiaquae]MDN3646113.1 hypothetical protein [Pontixanthobacter aestiaquae]MXO82895.1 hypothetical protein [Pontixanthobacter aestiaquae]